MNALYADRCDVLQPASSDFMNIKLTQDLAAEYSQFGIDASMLAAEVKVISDMLNKRKVTTSEEVLDCIQTLSIAFPNFTTFCHLILTFPVSSASAERSFSTMKRVKTYLRSSMSDNRLNNLCLLSSERELSQEIMHNPDAVVTEFATMKTRKLQLV